ncbi:MAG: phosphoglycerate kinase [Myxococcota bacterium]
MIRSVDSVSLRSRRVLMRVDFNVPQDGSQITDDTRIRAALPTIEYIVGEGGRLVLCSHLGRPQGHTASAFSLEPVAARLAELLKHGEVILTDDCIGEGVRQVVRDLRDSQVVLLENLRFHAEEVTDDAGFARQLARNADVYINDAFGTVHRAHASVNAVPRLLAERGAGFLMQKELRALERLRFDAPRPFCVVLGGSKVQDKISVVESMIDRLDSVLVGGAMANTFLAASGVDVGSSRIESERLPLARTILRRAKDAGVEVMLPSDLVRARSSSDSRGEPVDSDAVGAGWMALDIGPETSARFAERIKASATVFWNGPMGFFERAAFCEGTRAVARAVAESPAFSVVGGGDTAAAVHQVGLDEEFDHVSTGGGASLEYLKGKKLPGLEALQV